jgi:hypothetical protein
MRSLIIDVNSILELLHRLDVGDFAKASEVHTTSETSATSPTSKGCNNPRTELTPITRFYFQHTMGLEIAIPEISLDTQIFLPFGCLLSV